MMTAHVAWEALMASKKGPISFDLTAEQAAAFNTIAGGRTVRLSGRVVGRKVRVDYVACNSPFVACNSAFTACNAAFTACNSPFTACNAPFRRRGRKK
jgi:hypothetical protein